MENCKSARQALDARIGEVDARIAHHLSQIALLEAEKSDLNDQRNALAPIGRLPPELLVKIFSSFVTFLDHSDLMHFSEFKTFVTQEFLQSDSARREVYRKLLLPDIFTLCHVSRRWRHAAVGCQSLWTHIQIQPLTSAELLRFMWSNSGDLPIKLDFASTRVYRDFPEHIYPPGELVRELLRDYIHRFRSIGIYCNAPYLLDMLRGRAEALESLVVAMDHPDGPVEDAEEEKIYDQVLTGGTPNLRHIDLTSVTIPWSSSLLSSPHLTHVALEYTPLPNPESVAAMTAFLRKFRTTLETVKLAMKMPLEDEDMEFYLSNLLDRTPIELPNLKILDLHYGHHGPFMAILSLLRMPKDMTSIRLHCGFANEDTAEAAVDFCGYGLNPTDYAAPEEVEIRRHSVLCWREQRFTWLYGVVECSERILVMERKPTWIEITAQDIWDDITPIRLPWSFSNLRSITILHPGVPVTFWEILAASQTLEIVQVNALDVCRSFLRALVKELEHTGSIANPATGAVNNLSLGQSTGIQGKTIPFPALKAIAVFGDPAPRVSPMLASPPEVMMMALIRNIVTALKRRSTVVLEEIRIVSSVCSPPGGPEALLTAARCVSWENDDGEDRLTVYGYGCADARCTSWPIQHLDSTPVEPSQ